MIDPYTATSKMDYLENIIVKLKEQNAAAHLFIDDLKRKIVDQQAEIEALKAADTSVEEEFNKNVDIIAEFEQDKQKAHERFSHAYLHVGFMKLSLQVLLSNYVDITGKTLLAMGLSENQITAVIQDALFQQDIRINALFAEFWAKEKAINEAYKKSEAPDIRMAALADSAFENRDIQSELYRTQNTTNDFIVKLKIPDKPKSNGPA